MALTAALDNTNTIYTVCFSPMHMYVMYIFFSEKKNCNDVMPTYIFI